MKKYGRHLRIAVALLLVLMMLTSIFAVTASAVEESTEPEVETFDKPWYTITYTPATDSADAKIDVRIKTDYSAYSSITKADLAELKDEIMSVLYNLAFDSILGGRIEGSVEGEQPQVVFYASNSEGSDVIDLYEIYPDGNIPAELLAMFPDGKVPAALVDLLPEEYRDAILGGNAPEDPENPEDPDAPVVPEIPDVSNIDIGVLEDFLKEQLTAPDAKEKLDAVLDGKFDTVVKIAIDKYITESGHTYEEIEAKVSEVISGTVDDMYADELFEIIEEKKEEVKAKVEQLVTEVEEAHEKGESITLTPNDITSISSVKINGKYVYENDYFRTEAIKELISELPTPTEIKNFSDDEMVLNYDIEAEFVFGIVAIDFSIGLEGDCSEIRTVMGILADYLDVSFTGGKLDVKINVPAKLANAILKAIDSDKVSQETKHKVFAALSKNGGDVEALVNDLSFDEIIDILEQIDFEGVLDADFINKYVDVSDLTNEQIVNKVKQYEGYFNKAKNLAVKIFGKLPESLMSKTLFDLYDGNGTFSASGNKTFDVEQVLNKVSEKYAALIASFMDDPVVTVNASVEITFEKIYRVTYMVGSRVHADGFLPAGADVAFFGNLAEVETWVDENGAPVTEMPEADVVLYAANAFTLDVSDGITAVYAPGAEYTLTVTPTYTTINPNPTFTYQWYKDGVAIDGATEPTIKVSVVADSGVYYCVATVTDGEIEKTATSDEVTVSITKAPISFAATAWDYTAPFTYTGATFTVALVNLPSEITLTGYTGNEGINADNYVASFTFEYDEANYEIVDTVTPDLSWSIAKAVISLAGVKWNYIAPFTYSGESYTVALENLPAEITDVLYTDNAAALAGTYVAKATLVYDDSNYELDGTVEDLTWVINRQLIDLSGVKWSYTAPFVYTGEEFKVLLENLPAGVIAAYVNNVATNAGEGYHAVATLTLEDSDNYEISVSEFTLNWSIDKAVYDLSGVKWNYTAPFTYNGNQFVVELVGLPAGVEAVYGNNAKTTAGHYTATVVFNYDTNNYKLSDTVADLEWDILKVNLDVSGVTWNYTAPFTYNGQKFTVSLVGVPNGITVIYGENEKIGAGMYTATATLECDTVNYEIIGTVAPLQWEILKAKIVFDGSMKWNYDEINNPFVYNGNPFTVTVTGAPNGFTITGYQNNEKTNAGVYTATYTYDYDSDNYEFEGTPVASLTWKIEKATIDMSGVSFTDKEVNYDGNPHGITVNGTLPAGVTVTYSEEKTTVGVYTMTATFTVADPDNYNVPDAMTAKLTIKEAPHVHDFGTEWKFDENYHWKACACGEISDRAEHSDSDGDGKCDTCQHEIGTTPPHIHEFGSWKNDSNYHWKECACGEISEKNNHVDDNHDEKCDVCGYQLPHVHNYGTEWKFDENYHWNECSCGDVSNKAAHVDENGDGKCDICGHDIAVVPPHNHDFGSWKTDSTHHWKQCSCGEVIDKNTHADNNNDGKCDTCAYTMSVTPPKPGVNNSFDYKDGNGNVIVDIGVAEGLEEGTKVNVADKTNDYKDLDFSGILEEGKVGTLGAAYDITFDKDGNPVNVNGKNFNARILIPEHLRNKDHLIVVHIADNGELTVMESERDGDYMRFSTDHFSIYAVVAVDDAPEANNWWIWLLLAIILVLCIVIVLLIVFRRGGNTTEQKKDDEPKDDEPKDEAPAEEEKTEEAPVEETPVEEEKAPETAPVEETPVEEEKAEETAPVEETPVEEEPNADPTNRKDWQSGG